MLPAPVIAVLIIALGLPFVLLLILVSSSTGASTRIFTTALDIAVLSTFLMLMIFEIKRLADHPTRHDQ